MKDPICQVGQGNRDKGEVIPMYEEKEQCLNRIVIIKMKKACVKPSSLLFNVVEKDRCHFINLIFLLER